MVFEQIELTPHGPIKYMASSGAMSIDDEINHPSHYTRGHIEVLDFIQDQGLDYVRGNIIKYVCRAGHKASSPEIVDLQKAQFYLNWAIEKLKS